MWLSVTPANFSQSKNSGRAGIIYKNYSIIIWIFPNSSLNSLNESENQPSLQQT
jgi:hypothetical protein